MNSPEEILEFLRSRVTDATDCDEIAKLMLPLASDSAWVHLGGSGARQRVFLLPGNVRVIFQFDTNDLLVAYGAFRGSETWEKDQASASRLADLGANVPLIFVSGNAPRRDSKSNG